MKRLKIMPVICVPDHPEKEGDLEAAAQVFLTALKDFVSVRQTRLAIFMTGSFLEAAVRKCPKELAWLREQAKEGIIEPLGGGFHEALFPLFPKELQVLQMRKHRELLRSAFAFHPRGWLCPSKAWEISLTSVLCSQDYEFTILADTDFSEVLAQPLPITGWRTIEDGGHVVRVFPSHTLLSEAWGRGDSPAMLKLLGELPESESGCLFEGQAFPENWTNGATELFKALGEVIENADSVGMELQSWTPSRIIDQSKSSGGISLISTLRAGLGLPGAVHTCRELLNRRPESNFIHKKLLYLHYRAHQVLNSQDAQTVDSLLLSVQSARFYRNLPSPHGIRGLFNRALAHQQLIEAEKTLDKLSGRSMRLEVVDFLGDGNRQILASTPELGFLLEQQYGGVLRSLDFKPLAFNWINGQLEDGAPSVGLRDHLIPPDSRSLREILGCVEDCAGQLVAPFDYQIKRQSDRIQLVLTGEQGVPVQGHAHSLRMVKVIGFKLEDAELQISWQLTNATFHVARCQFATECVVTFPDDNRRKQSLKLDGKRLSWSDVPCVRSGVQALVFDDRALGARIQLDFVKPAGVLISPVLGSSMGAAPEEFQGYRLVFLWDLELKGQESTAFHIRLRMDKRRLFL